jgi:predicted amidohydrolase
LGKTSRFVAVSNKIDLAAARSQETLTAELERIFSLAEPHISRHHPSLVVLAEHLGLTAIFLGEAGERARCAKSSEDAFRVLLEAHAPKVERVKAMWGQMPDARALLLALTDQLWRSFTAALSRLAARRQVYLIACTNVAAARLSTEESDVSSLGFPGQEDVFVPVGPGVYNTAFLFGPDGAIIGAVRKVNLTPIERYGLGLTPGDLADVPVFDTEVGRIGIATSLDAFIPSYVEHLERLGAQVVAQPDANPQPWAFASATHEWQPQEWLNSVLGCLQDRWKNILYNVCSMQTGNLFEIAFDGQSSITARDTVEPEPSVNFVGNEGFCDTRTGESFKGRFLALAPWVMDDPVISQPDLPLSRRRQLLSERALSLLPGGASQNQYLESAIRADVTLP